MRRRGIERGDRVLGPGHPNPDRLRVLLVLGGLIFAAVGTAMGDTFFLRLATEALIFAGLALSVDILLILALSSERALTYARRTRKVPKRISGRPGDSAAI